MRGKLLWQQDPLAFREIAPFHSCAHCAACDGTRQAFRRRAALTEAAAAWLENGRKLYKAIQELEHYISVNRAFVPNYGDRYRHGEIISTAFVESTVNQVVSKRMAKQQQMRRTQRGAHLLLQVRTQTLNGDLRGTFCRWYAGMKRDAGKEQPKRAAA